MASESRIAVIGMACRLPGGVDTPDSLWSLLSEGRDGRTEVPADRWDWRSFYHQNPDAKEATNFSHGYFLKDDVSAFDARFFGIPGAEAAGIDPQQRMLLEIAYEAIENAGIPIESLRGSNTSVHMAQFARDYDRMGYRDAAQLHKSHIIGSGDAILANRISYLLDLKGTSNTLDTGCSGGLVALHQACRTLRADESTLALAGASQLMLTPDQSIAMSQLTNPDGRCYTFDDRGAGYARGEGLGVLVLKRLDRAVADGDNIHAVIVESGANHDGKTSGIFLPNPDAQEALARSVYSKAGLDPRETLFVETHGTGTVAGDGAEVSSISKVFGREAGRDADLIIGSIKSNIGHLESASGVASMIKAIMVLKKNQIPPQLNFINPKPSLHLEERGIKVPLELCPLAPEGHTGPRRVSVNSFGYGGTNAHAIIEAFEPAPLTNGYVNGNGLVNGNGHVNGTKLFNGTHQSLNEQLVVLSANSELSLTKMIAGLRQWAKSDSTQSTSFDDLVYTLNVRRSKLPWRCSVVASDFQELATALSGAKLKPVKAARDVALAFVFTGQGAQWYAMGRELLESSRAFAASVAACNEDMQALGCAWDLVEELSRDNETSRLGQAAFSQPSCTAVQIALVDLLGTFGIRPAAVCGHSSGEIAAAYAAGALTRQAAMEVAYMRGICSSEAKSLNATQGAMLAVGEGEEAINQKIKQLDSSNGRVTVACVNSPESTTISGDLAAIQKLQSVLDAASVFNRRLAVDSAYHSHHMEVVAQSYLSSLEEMPHSKPREDVAFYSSVTASRKKSGFGPAYWVSNLVSQVKFSAAAQLVAQHFEATSATVNAVMVEVGPHSALSGPLRQSLSDFKLASGAVFKYNYVPCLIRKESAIAMVLALAGKVFEAGHPVELEAVRIGEEEHKSHPSRRRVVENLPTYPWDHSSTYWHESRLSKKHRQRAFPPHDLLGLFDVQSSPYEPRWRYHVSLEALPWLRDHMVEGFVIFPGVGYLIMVLEAMKQLFQLRGTPGRIRNINFRDVTFAKPVVVHDDAKKGNREVELQLVLSPSRQHAGSPWEHFRVLSYDALNDAWIDHCAGFASWDGFVSETPSQPHADEVVGARDDGLGHLTKAAADQWLQDIREGCPTAVDAEQTYQELRASGNEYGPSFQGLKEIHVGKQYGLAKVVVDDVVQQMPGHYMQPHTIHPTAFDSLIQLVAVVFRRECTVAPMMPVSLGEVSVAVDMDSTPGTEVTVALHLTPETKREATANFCAYIKQSDGTYRPVVTGFAIRPQAVGDADSDEVQKKMTYRMEWKPDVNHVTHNDFMDHAEVNGLFDVDLGKTSQDPAEVQLQLNDTVATIFIRRAVQRAREEGISTACKPHLTMLLNWMMKWDQSDALQFLEGVTPEDEEKLIEQASRSNIVGLTLSRLGPQYLDLFTGRKDALELLVQEELLGRLYSEYTLFNCHYAQMADYMQALVHKNPRMRVLEIGAGTGGATMPLLRRIERDGRLPVDAYTYTDISAGFFEKARAKFGAWAGQMRFQTLDVARDPLAQGYAAGSFDLIVASIVLHATPLMDVTVAHARALLRPGGRLVLMELTAVAAAQNAIFGTLEGWWMAADGRRDGPLLTVPEWDACLKRHGFSGTDLAIPAQKGRSSDVSTVIVATALPETAEASESTDSQPAAMKANIHLGDSEDASQVALGKELIHSLSEKGADCSQEAWSTEPMAEDPNRLTIVVDSAEHPLLLDPSQETFERIRHLLLQTANVLWVSFQGSEPSGEKEALKNMANGLAKVVRRENPGLRLVTVDVQDPVQTEALGQVGRTITELAHSSFWSPEATRADENEYAIRGGQVHIPRIVPDDRFAKYIDSRHPEQEKGEAALVECKYLDKARPLVFDVQMPGLLNTIRFVDNEEMAEPLGPDQVEVQAQAYGLNFKDVFVALGQMAPGTEMASEVAGVITAVGSNVDTWKAGDRVAAIMVAPFGNLVRVDKRGLAAIPGSLSFEDAASVTIVYYTAWYCLHQVARLEPGQSVLIHAASGGVGQAAIQLAQHAGAEVFATVSTAAKKRLVQARYGIPDSHVFSSHTRHFKKHLLAATRGRGVDVVLNSLAGQLLMDSWDCVAQFGTFVEIGKSDINGRSQLGMANFEKQATFASVDVSHMYRQRPERVTRGFAEVFSLLDRGLVKLVHPVTQYPMSRIEEAFRLMAARKHVGKLVLVADEDTMVRATKPKAPALRLQREGTYVIGGGLGDLGKRMGRFLAEKGAGHIVALTRRNVDAQEQAPLKEAISELGATLHIVQCDIGDEDSTRAAAKEIADLPPVRGVIQSALVLCDHPLEYMEVGDWKTAVKPKVQGTLNMHAAFCSPETTDFFVMLSSVASVIGSNSQSNYAAGNAFQDAFAHAQKQYPHGITHYTTINIGAVEGSDQIARALDQKSEIVKIIGSVSFADVFATLEYAMGGQARADEARQCLMHFSRDTMEDAAGAEALADHIYDHIPSQRAQGDKTANGASDKDKPSALQAVQQAPSVADAETIVRQALLDKFVAFIGDEVPDDQPVSSLGLDSLVSIELKNWVKHTFHTPLQTSELSGAPSVVALAKLVVSRMELKCKASVAVPEEEEKRNETTAGLVEPEPEPKPATATNGHVNGIVNGTNGVTKAQRVPDCCKFHSEVPAQPLPDLDDTLDYWLQANEHLFSPEQLEPIYKDFKAMRAADSPARQILEDLYRQHGHDKTNGWFTDVVTDARFLCSRAPIAPGSSIMGGHRGSDKIQSQAERAAVITCAARSFKRAAKAGEVEPLQIAGKPECTWRWGWMFNSTRVPKPKCDKMVSYASDEQIVRQDHVAVLRKGHVFRVALQDADGKDTPFKQLEATFDAIVDRVEGEGVWSGLLTTDDRDSWAEIRTTLEAVKPGNAEYFRVIDSALCVVCLDAGSPDTPEEIARQGYIGNGFNRWFDKVLQFYVSANGRSGQITEHGIIDGTTPARLLEYIHAGITSYSDDSTTTNGHLNGVNGSSSSIELDEVVLQTTPEIDNRMLVLADRFQQTTSAATYVREQLDEFGTDFLIQSRAPVKGVIDLTFQLAVRLFFGQNMLSWEPMTAVHFHTGRADAMQRASPAVNTFCDAAAKLYHPQEQQPEDMAQLKGLLQSAAKEMQAGMQAMLGGRSYLRVFEVLSYLWPADAGAPKPAFLGDMVFFGRPHPPIFAQSNALDSDIVVDDFVHLMPDADGFWAILCPEKDKIRISFTGGSAERTTAFAKDLHSAAEIMRDIVQART